MTGREQLTADSQADASLINPVIPRVAVPRRLTESAMNNLDFFEGVAKYRNNRVQASRAMLMFCQNNKPAGIASGRLGAWYGAGPGFSGN